MNQKRKLGKRIASLFLCLEMVFGIINLPMYSYVVNAAESSSISYTEIFDFTDEGFKGNNPIVRIIKSFKKHLQFP